MQSGLPKHVMHPKPNYQVVHGVFRHVEIIILPSWSRASTFPSSAGIQFSAVPSGAGPQFSAVPSSAGIQFSAGPRFSAVNIACHHFALLYCYCIIPG